MRIVDFSSLSFDSFLMAYGPLWIVAVLPGILLHSSNDVPDRHKSIYFGDSSIEVSADSAACLFELSVENVTTLLLI